MKHLTHLLKTEYLMLRRQAAYFLLSIGLPCAFYLIFSGIMSSSNTPTLILQVYLFSMTLFSIMSSAFFSVPSVLRSDKSNNWQKILHHSPVSMVEYYVSKLLSTLIIFLLSILVVFAVGHWVRGVNLPLADWFIIGLILLVGSLVFVMIGVVLSLIPSTQLMSVISNIVYMGLAVLGGLWFPLSFLPQWLHPLAKATPSYQLMQVVTIYLTEQRWNWTAILIVFCYTLLASFGVYIINKKIEVK